MGRPLSGRCAHPILQRRIFGAILLGERMLYPHVPPFMWLPASWSPRRRTCSPPSHDRRVTLSFRQAVDCGTHARRQRADAGSCRTTGPS
jgi:hypothetical protein